MTRYDTNLCSWKKFAYECWLLLVGGSFLGAGLYAGWSLGRWLLGD